MAAQTDFAIADGPQVISDGADGEAVIDLRVASGIKVFGSHTGLAEYLGVARTQPGRWLKGAERPTPDTFRLIMDLDWLWGRLTMEMNEETARIWLRSANAFLGGAAPLNWLKMHGPSRVIGAFDSAEAGSYA